MKPKIALTFDDGPSEHTSRILDTLEKYKTRASFFVTGQKIEAGTAIIKRAAAAGNEIISHTWSHCDSPPLSQLSADEIRKELLDTHAAVERVVGFSPAMFRPPYGSLSDTLKNVAKELGLTIILWGTDAWDWRSRNADCIYNEIFSNTYERDVILCHDNYTTTADAMERVVPDLLVKYEMVTLSELMKEDGLMPGAPVMYPLGSETLVKL
jgi:peptidoglycan/xylan/chitin deacetylase (PgdA/CDA1 family)